MIISAIWRSSEEMPRIDGSSRFSTYGPSTMPVTSIPIILGNPIRSQIAAMARPARKINASEVNMFFSISILCGIGMRPLRHCSANILLSKIKKADVLCDFCCTQTSFLRTFAVSHRCQNPVAFASKITEVISLKFFQAVPPYGAGEPHSRRVL